MQSIRLNSSTLHEATAYLTTTTQLLSNKIPFHKSGFLTFGHLTTRNHYQKPTN